jgi:hypothetical protein
VKDKRKIKVVRWSHLAGLVDGDGSISIRRDLEKGYQLTIMIYSTWQPLMKLLITRFGGAFRPLPTTGNRKQRYCWYTSNRAVVEGLAPHLVLKKRQGEIALNFLSLGREINPQAREELMNDLQAENQSFVPVVRHSNTQPNTTPCKSDFAYLAGLFDAEGSFSIFKRAKAPGNGSYTSCARISNTDDRVFPWLLERFGGRMQSVKRSTRTEGCWSLNGKQDRERKILAILPYLTIKKERAVLLLQWIRRNHSMTRAEKAAMFDKMAVLNLRGLSPEANMPKPSLEG